MYLIDACLEFLGIFFSPEVMEEYSNIFFGVSLTFSFWLLYQLFVRPGVEISNYAWAKIRNKGRK